MTAPAQQWIVSAMVLAMAASAGAQVASPSVSTLLLPQTLSDVSPSLDGSLELQQFKESDIKFSLQSLMETLRDHHHEGWVLAAYPDPNTHRPLIGAGFSLDLLAAEHPQTDPLNPHSFVEPSSAQLWQSAGLPPALLQQILDQFAHNTNVWSDKTYRRKIVRRTLTEQLTEQQATQLLRISAIQAIYNAKAYCREFDQLTGPQQMALSQLVFQMGTNLEQFVQFLDAVNDQENQQELAQLDGYMETPAEHWSTVQSTLIDSQWARRYSIRAATVIAMFDPEYSHAPYQAEERVQAVLHPPVVRRPKERTTATLRAVSYSKRSSRKNSKKLHPQARRKLT